MKYAVASLGLVMAVLSVGQAQAADTGSKTREQVLAELAQAQRTGDILVNKDSEGAGRTLREVNPSAYPVKAEVAGKTRAQVLAELAQAQRTGDILVNKDSEGAGRTLREVNPSAYPVKAEVAGKTREQVLAELAQAQRAGGVDLYPSSL